MKIVFASGGREVYEGHVGHHHEDMQEVGKSICQLQLSSLINQPDASSSGFSLTLKSHSSVISHRPSLTLKSHSSAISHRPSEMSPAEGRKRPRKSSEMSAGEDTSSDKDKASLGNPNDGLTKGAIEEEKKKRRSREVLPADDKQFENVCRRRLRMDDKHHKEKKPKEEVLKFLTSCY